MNSKDMEKQDVLKEQAFREGPEVHYRAALEKDPDMTNSIALGMMVRCSAMTLLDLCGAIFHDFARITVKDFKSHRKLEHHMKALNAGVKMTFNHPKMKGMKEMTPPIDFEVLFEFGLEFGTCVKSFIMGPLQQLYQYLEKERALDLLPHAKYIPLQIDKF